MQHIIVYGGSFDPPHLAHARLPLKARRQWAVENDIDPAATLLLYVPAARSPHKTGTPQATDAQRIAMLQLALGQALTDANAPVDIDSTELNRAAARPGEPSYTIDTVTALRAQLDSAGCQHTRLHLLIGTDQLLALHRWHRARELVALAPPLVMLRPPHTELEPLAEALLETGAWSPADLACLLAALVTVPTMDASSTAARAAAAVGDSSALDAIVGPEVGGYIRRSELYLPAGGHGGGAVSTKRLAIIALLSCILLGIGCVVGLVIWRIAEPVASPQPAAVQPVSLFTSLPAQLLIGGFVLSILGGVASVGLWLFAAAPKHPDAET